MIGFDVEGVEALAESLAEQAGLGEAFRDERGNYERAPIRNHFTQRAQGCMTALSLAGFELKRAA